MTTFTAPQTTTVAVPTDTAVATDTSGAERTARLRGATLAAFRVVIGFQFLCHAGQGLFGWFGGVDTQGGAMPIGMWPGWYAGMIGLIGGTLVLLGLFTRVAAIVCSGSMAYAYFVVHQPEGLLPVQNMGEPAAMFCWSFLLIGVFGAGSIALDDLRRTRS